MVFSQIINFLFGVFIIGLPFIILGILGFNKTKAYSKTETFFLWLFRISCYFEIVVSCFLFLLIGLSFVIFSFK